MEQTVYADLLFFVNFCMDFQCLFLAARLLHRPFYLRRSLLAAALGAFYACAALFLPFAGVAAFFVDLGVCFAMCALAFFARRQGMRGLLIPFGIYFGISFALGGVMSGMANLLSRLEIVPRQGGGEQSTWLFFLLAFVGGLATFLWGRLCQRRAKGTRVQLRVCAFEREVCVTALLDTANLLCDPLTGRPVVILAHSPGEQLLPPELFALVERGSVDLTALPARFAHRVRLIPAKTVTGSGLLLSVLPDSAALDTGRGERPVEILVALAPLSVPNDCGALVPAVLHTE